MATRILTVDDSPTIRQQLRIFLESQGYRVDEADSGEAGLQAVQRARFDLIIADVNMPGMSGLEMVIQLRQVMGYGDTPVFMLTTQADREMKSQGKAAGATAWIVKPFRPKVLLAGIQKALGAHTP